mmetsp:Transcript_2926/g.7998  ORF Transcript_2926/g.7998 Transcript_2926/m.7998 type:complete len:95 (-) Transcript_2926:512-796(-)
MYENTVRAVREERTITEPPSSSSYRSDLSIDTTYTFFHESVLLRWSIQLIINVARKMAEYSSSASIAFRQQLNVSCVNKFSLFFAEVRQMHASL